MKLFFFPARYTESDNYDKGEGNFVRVDSQSRLFGHGTQWRFQEVRRVFPGVYEATGQIFWDFKDMFSRVK